MFTDTVRVVNWQWQVDGSEQEVQTFQVHAYAEYNYLPLQMHSQDTAAQLLTVGYYDLGSLGGSE